jgi:peroxiredoxin
MAEQQTISWKILPLIAFIAATAGYAFYSLNETTSPTNAAPNPSSIIGMSRAGFTLPDLKGKPRHIKEWNGKVILLNFWATWCPPCRREMPGFIEIKKQYAAQGFEIIGIAVDDLNSVREFTNRLDVNYPILQGQNDVSIVASHYGNEMGMLPYSVIIDQNGKIQFARAGKLNKKDLENELKKLL